jgi:hypothetical protein
MQKLIFREYVYVPLLPEKPQRTFIVNFGKNRAGQRLDFIGPSSIDPAHAPLIFDFPSTHRSGTEKNALFQCINHIFSKSWYHS